MSSRYLFTPEPLCTSSIAVSISATSPGGEDRTSVGARSRTNRTPPSSLLIRLAMRVSRSRWFIFLRRVFHYQNGSRSSELGSNPFNSGAWMIAECVTLVSQIVITLYTLTVSMDERPVWPMRMWVIGYAFGCVLSLVLLYWRFQLFYVTQRDGLSLSDIEQQRSRAESRSFNYLNKCRASAELFFAIWFVMGNVWVFDSRFGSFHRAPKLHVLCITLLAWNAINYSFPFILFVLLCCCVPLMSSLLGYNMNMASIDRGASEEQLSGLPSWRYKEVGNNNIEPGNSALEVENPECCICLARYKEKEEIRQLPCSHIFHLKCVDQWLRIISSCPLCKQALER